MQIFLVDVSFISVNQNLSKFESKRKHMLHTYTHVQMGLGIEKKMQIELKHEIVATDVNVELATLRSICIRTSLT